MPSQPLTFVRTVLSQDGKIQQTSAKIDPKTGNPVLASGVDATLIEPATELPRVPRPRGTRRTTMYGDNLVDRNARGQRRRG